MTITHDDAVDVVKIEEVNEDLIATVSVWVQVKIGDDFYTVEKQFKGKLVQ